MSATEELRRLLDERVVEWWPSAERWCEDSITYWRVGAMKWTAIEGEKDLWLNAGIAGYEPLTPEQAVVATLGRGMCHDEGDPCDFCCSECGMRMFIEANDTYTMIASDERTIIKHPNFCPNCGRRIEVIGE